MSFLLPTSHRSDLVLGLFRVVCVGNFFVFLAATLQWYQSLDLFVDVGAIRTQGVVGVDILCCYLLTCTFYLDGMVGLKRPGPTLLVRVRETVPRLTCNLYCISGWRVSVSLAMVRCDLQWKAFQKDIK